MPSLGISSDSQLNVHCFVLIICTKSHCWYRCKWYPVLMIILLVKYYIYLSWHLVKCCMFIILSLSSSVFLYFHFCCSNVTGLLVNSPKIPKFLQLSFIFSCLRWFSFSCTSHAMHQFWALSVSVLSAASAHTWGVSVLTGVLLDKSFFPYLLYLPARTVNLSCVCVCCMRLGKTDLP